LPDRFHSTVCRRHAFKWSGFVLANYRDGRLPGPIRLLDGRTVADKTREPVRTVQWRPSATDADLQPWDKRGNAKQLLTKLYDEALVWVYGDFGMNAPERPDGWPDLDAKA